MEFNKLEKGDFDIMLAEQEKNLLYKVKQSERDSYIDLYFLYRKLLTEYIIKEINLKKYDDTIANSGLRFTQVEELDMDSYQYFSSNVLKYFYIRNDINLKKLNKEDIKILKERLNNKNYELDEKIRQIIERTYKEAIFKDLLNNGNLCMTFYGPDSKSYMVRNDSLVIGMRYDEFAENGLDDNEWDQLHDKQQIFLDKVIDDMNTELNKRFIIPISILRYNEFSVIPRREINDIEGVKLKKDEEER